jgi:hypothetical protein
MVRQLIIGEKVFLAADKSAEQNLKNIYFISELIIEITPNRSIE